MSDLCLCLPLSVSLTTTPPPSPPPTSFYYFAGSSVQSNIVTHWYHWLSSSTFAHSEINIRKYSAVLNCSFVLSSMPPKRNSARSRYAERISKRRRLATTAQPAVDVQPLPDNHPNPADLEPQPVVSSNTAALSPETIAAISAAVSAGIRSGLQEAGITRPRANPPTTPRPQVEFVSDIPASTSHSATPVVQQAVAQAVGQLTGAPHASPSKTTQFISHSLPLAARVPDRVKAKIWANDYIDIGTLLNASVASEDSYVFKVLQGENGQPVVSVVPNEKRRTIQTIEQWTGAFQTFVAIFVEKHPEATPGLMKYSSIVRELAAQGANWRFYDENFRMLRQQETVPWDQLHSELWLRAQSQRNQVNQSQRSQAQLRMRYDSSSIPKGFCFRFHNGTHCDGCSYKHQCFQCGGNHPIFRCKSNRAGSGERRGFDPTPTRSETNPSASDTTPSRENSPNGASHADKH